MRLHPSRRSPRAPLLRGSRAARPLLRLGYRVGVLLALGAVGAGFLKEAFVFAQRALLLREIAAAREEQLAAIHKDLQALELANEVPAQDRLGLAPRYPGELVVWFVRRELPEPQPRQDGFLEKLRNWFKIGQ